MIKNKKIKDKSQPGKNINVSSLENKIVKSSLDSNYELGLLENTNAYYSERYGWTLKRNS